MVLCKVCNVGFEQSQDNLILCKHQEGPVHLGCCISHCSQHGQPCNHAAAVFEKLRE